MIKSVSPTILRNTALGLLVAGSFGVNATNTDKGNNYVTQPNQTELVSKAGAEALKANSVQIVTQSNVPTVHYDKLDETFRKFIEDENDRKDINNLIDNLYTDCGTFLGTAYIQHELNTRMLYTFTTGNTKLLRDNNIAPELAREIEYHGEDFYKTVKPNAETVMNWAMTKYTPYFASRLSFDHKPTAEEVSKELDDIINNEPALPDKDKQRIKLMTHNYQMVRLKDKKDTESMSKLIAYKVNMFDTYMFFRELVAAGIYADGYFRYGGREIRSYYTDWMYYISPSIYDKTE